MMRILLWIVQVALALLAFAGGAYKVLMFGELAKLAPTRALSHGAWTTLGVFEVVCAILLIVPAAMNWMPVLTAVAAAALAVESFGLAVLYARYSVQLRATNPMVWVVAMGLMAAFVAYGRYARMPR